MSPPSGSSSPCTKGVKSVQEIAVGYAAWRKPSGGWTGVLVVGSDKSLSDDERDKVIEGTTAALSAPAAVLVDRTYLKDLGINGLGDRAEINEYRVNVVALSNGVRAFTTIPYVFTSLTNARDLLDAGRFQASYQLVTLEKGARPAWVKTLLKRRLNGVEVMTHDEFRERSLMYWLFETGAGTSLIGGAMLGLIIGIVVVAQTLYGSTKDHLNEFATLRALGASGAYIYTVILIQAIASAVAGYAIGMAIVLAVIKMTKGSGLDIVMTPELAFTIFCLTVGICILASAGAIMKATRLDPATVFSR
jgi:putative ABC transport system permease protein